MISQLLIALHRHSEIADNARRDLQQGIESVALFSSHTHTQTHTPKNVTHLSSPGYYTRITPTGRCQHTIKDIQVSSMDYHFLV